MKNEENAEVARIWFEINNNLQKYRMSWEWMEKDENGEYLLFEDVIKVIESHLKSA